MPFADEFFAPRSLNLLYWTLLCFELWAAVTAGSSGIEGIGPTNWVNRVSLEPFRIGLVLTRTQSFALWVIVKGKSAFCYIDRFIHSMRWILTMRALSQRQIVNAFRHLSAQSLISQFITTFHQASKPLKLFRELNKYVRLVLNHSSEFYND